MQQLVANVNIPIAGCILLAVVLADAAFENHTEESYRTPFHPKVGSFTVLDQCVDIKGLDFLVALSSAASFGNAGQTNYAR
jgi:hypothetical protein